VTGKVQVSPSHHPSYVGNVREAPAATTIPEVLYVSYDSER
jgi:hypothetical protein